MKEKGRAETLYFFITERYQYSHAGPVNKLRQVAVKQSKQQRRQKGTAGNAEKAPHSIIQNSTEYNFLHQRSNYAIKQNPQPQGNRILYGFNFLIFFRKRFKQLHIKGYYAI